MVARSTPYAITALCLVGFLLIGCGDDATEPQTGSIKVTLSITGASPDADGCQFDIDGATGLILLDGEGVTHSFSVGTHTVTITDVAFNCFVQGEASRSVDVSADQTTAVDFTLDCPTPGSIEVSTTTTGSAVDPDGYTVTLDGGTSVHIGVNDKAMFSDLAVREYELELNGVADHCAVLGENPITVTVPEAEGAPINFTVACPPFYDYIAFVRSSGLWVMESDGSNPVNLTQGSSSWGEYPAWAPDATHIAFTSMGDIWVLNTASMDLWQVTNGAEVGLCSWSPDGDRLVYDSWIAPSQGDTWGDIYVVNVDGSNPVNLTPGSLTGFEPAWSPDGNLIAFATKREGGLNIWTMEPDGSNAVRLSDVQDPQTVVSEQAFEPAWSADGSRLAFIGPGEPCCGIWVIDADGSSAMKLIEGYPERPTWSPDGTRIAYHEWGDDQREIFVIQADGSNPVNLTGDAGGFSPAWSPGQ